MASPEAIANPGRIGNHRNTVRTSLDQLPERKRRDLERIVQILFSEFEDATRLATQKWRKQGRILKIILFGSYARGDWVEDPKGGYYSDYDLLVIVNDERLTDVVDYWGKADDHLMREVTIAKSISAPVSFIVHSIADVNEQLQRGRPFFIDIVRDGIVLYELEGHEFAPPKPLSAEEQSQQGRRYFDEWFPSIERRLDLARTAIEKGYVKEAAFDLHQTAERLYHCLLLVLTLYSPKSHKLGFLRGQAETHDARLIGAWPRDTKFAQRCFELLRRAYVEARYSPHYVVTGRELAWIAQRVDVLQDLVRAICEGRLALDKREAPRRGIVEEQQDTIP